MTVSSFHLGHHSSKFFLFPVENYADMLSTANTGHTQLHRHAVGPHVHFLMPGKMQMRMPQLHELHHMDINADTQVRLS